MKKCTIAFFLISISLIFSGCGLKSDIQGTYSSQSRVIVVDDDRITVYYKGKPEKPISVVFYDVVKEDKHLSKLYVDLKSESDGEPYAREAWKSIDGDEIRMFDEEGDQFHGFEEENLEDYESADPEDVEK